MRTVLVHRCSGPAVFSGLRLPDCQLWCWSSNGAASMRFRWGNITVGPVEVLGAAGISTNHVHPGTDVFVEFDGPAGNLIFIHTHGVQQVRIVDGDGRPIQVEDDQVADGDLLEELLEEED